MACLLYVSSTVIIGKIDCRRSWITVTTIDKMDAGCDYAASNKSLVPLLREGRNGAPYWHSVAAVVGGRRWAALMEGKFPTR